MSTIAGHFERKWLCDNGDYKKKAREAASEASGGEWVIEDRHLDGIWAKFKRLRKCDAHGISLAAWSCVPRPAMKKILANWADTANKDMINDMANASDASRTNDVRQHDIETSMSTHVAWVGGKATARPTCAQVRIIVPQNACHRRRRDRRTD